MLVLPKIPKRWHLWVATPYDSTSKPTKIFQENSTNKLYHLDIRQLATGLRFWDFLTFWIHFCSEDSRFNQGICRWLRRTIRPGNFLWGPTLWMGIQEGDDFDTSILGRGFDNYVLRDVWKIYWFRQVACCCCCWWGGETEGRAGWGVVISLMCWLLTAMMIQCVDCMVVLVGVLIHPLWPSTALLSSFLCLCLTPNH